MKKEFWDCINNRNKISINLCGVPDIYLVWAQKGWDDPIVEEQYGPDRTILTLAFTEKQAEKTSGKNKRKKQAKKQAEKTSGKSKRKKQAEKASGKSKTKQPGGKDGGQ